MAELIVTEFVTLDGVMEAPGGEPGHPHTGWVIPHAGPEWEADKHREMEEAGALVLGRLTYESHAEAWPHVEGPFGDRMNAMPKLVASRTLTVPAWNNTRVLPGDAVGALAALRAEPGDPLLVVGSHRLVQQLFAADLVDRLRLMVFPVAVGGGRRLFPADGARRAFTLAATTGYPKGVTLLELVRAP